MERELRRLLRREGFRLHAGTWEQAVVDYSSENPPSMSQLKRKLAAAPGNHWAGLQVYYPMTETDVRCSTGLDLVESMLAVFDELTAIMNFCSQTPLRFIAARRPANPG
jgi:hypothetical protein